MPSPFREYAKGYVFWRNSAKFCYREKIHFREKNTFFAIIDIFSTVSRICCGSTQNFEKLSEKQIFSHNFSQKHFCYISKIFKLKWSIIVVDCLVSVVRFCVDDCRSFLSDSVVLHCLACPVLFLDCRSSLLLSVLF